MVRIIFMGTPHFAVPSLEALTKLYDITVVVTQPDRPVGRGRHLAVPPVKDVALRLGLAVMQPRTLRDASAVDQLQALEPTVIVVAAYGEILRPDVLSLPPLGCINVHASLLPKYRGAAPIPAAILQGEMETGITLMLMDSGLDTGPILAQLKVPLHSSDTALSLSSRLARQGAALLVETLPMWLDGEIVPQPQDRATATYAPRISKADGLIDWTQEAEMVDRRCRAYHPWPGAFTSCDGQRLKVLRAFSLPNEAASVEPGRVLQLPEGIGVSTGLGIVILEEVQLAGKRAMSAIEFARGQRGFVGSRLGLD